MSYFLTFFLSVLVIAALLSVLTTAKPARIADAIRLVGPILLIVIGGLFTVVGRGGVGLPLLGLGVALWGRYRLRKAGQAANPSPGKKSTVRSAWLEMELDHDSGDMDGLVLTGDFDGARLSELSENELDTLYQSLAGDGDSAALMEAYLDRTQPGWREYMETDTAAGQGAPSGSGPMAKEEAYQILGLAPGAAANDIRAAHRRLMKRIHPDSGGSTFLAAKINEAKDVLLN